MKTRSAKASPRASLLLGLLVLTATPAAAAGDEAAEWSDYLDWAYVYSSAEPDVLRERLARYGRETGIPFEDHVSARLDAGGGAVQGMDERETRREAIAYLLHYLARGEPRSLSASVRAVQRLDDSLQQQENRYWYRYVLAHEALEKGDADAFAEHLLALWLEVVVPLENTYEMLHTLSLGESRHSGFASALPYVFENLSRLILIRSQRRGLHRGLDPLAVLVRLLYDGRVGTHTDVVPEAASSRDYLQRIVERLDGAESDAGSLGFTLALFEASRLHEEARSLLASRGLSPETLEAIRVSSGAYETALGNASTLQGRCAVYTRVLRQLGEIYAAKQRLGVDPAIETPFSIEGAIEVYALLRAGRGGGWKELGFWRGGRAAWLDAMHRLWEEIQETSLNAADYYLARSVEEPHRAKEYSRNAARIQSRYLSLFEEFATRDGRETVPESAFFAAYEAARGFGDALVAYAPDASRQELNLAIERYLEALRLFPFERELWSALAVALQRQGRESLYLTLVRPIGESVSRSRQLDVWIESGEPGAQAMDTLRQALSDDLVLMYLGFAESEGIEALEASLRELRARRERVAARVGELGREREGLAGRPAEVPASADTALPASRPSEAVGRARPLARVESELSSARAQLAELERRIEARARALPLYRAALRSAELTRQLRSRRDHPVHALLRRLYYERSA